jgi:hypothetical protein
VVIVEEINVETEDDGFV